MQQEHKEPLVLLQGEHKVSENTRVEAALAPVVRTYEELTAVLSSVSGVTKVVTSGFFNPIHKNHISNIISSKYLPGELFASLGLPEAVHLTVVVNGDWSAREKLGGSTFLTAEERADVVRAVRGVDLVFIHEVEVHHQAAVIALGCFDVFTKGGDRYFASLPPEEQAALRATGTLMIGNVGYEKREGTPEEVSSSRMRARVVGKHDRT
jgi:glycerol-3-phosphate cytidylyltransferase-like family protein